MSVRTVEPHLDASDVGMLCFRVRLQWWTGPESMALKASQIKCREEDVLLEEGSVGEADLGSSLFSEGGWVKHNAEEVNAQRGKFSHALQFSGLVLMDRVNKRLCDLAAFITAPMEEDQAMAIAHCKTRRGDLRLYVEAARGHQWRVAARMVANGATVVSSMGVDQHVAELHAEQAVEARVLV